MIVNRMRELAPEYTDRREMITGKYENGVLLADPASGLEAGYIWAHDADNRNSVPVVVGPGMGDYALVAAGVRVKTGLNRYGERVAIEPAGDSQSAAAVAQLQAAAAAARPVYAANITGGRVAPSGSGLDIFVEALDEVGWAGGTITGDSGDLPTGLGEFCWWIVYFPPGTSTPTYAATTPALVNTKDDLPASDAFDYGLPPGSLRTQALTVFTGETDITKDNTRILDMRRRGIEGNLLTGNAVLRTLASGVLTVGAECLVRVAAQSGTADDWQQVVVSGGSRLLGFLADTGDTITAKQYVSGSDNLYTYAGADLDFTGEQLVFGWWDADDAVLRILGGGGGGAFTDLTDTFAYSGNGDKAVFVNAGETALEARDAMPVASKTRLVGTMIHDETLGSSGAFDVSSIPAGYDRLELRLTNARGTVSAAVDTVRIYFNNDTTAGNYRYVLGTWTGGSYSNDVGDAPNAGYVPAATADADYVGWLHIDIDEYDGAKTKIAETRNVERRSATVQVGRHGLVHWENTAAINQIQIRTDNHATDLFAAGTRLQIIGWKQEAIGGVAYVEGAISATPTNAELDSLFGTPATLPENFAAVVKDSGDATNQWFVRADGDADAWLGVQLAVLS